MLQQERKRDSQVSRRSQRQDPRTELAKAAIMDAAERLFALNGVEGVALRQIRIEAKQTYKDAIHHFFGDREDLVIAILRRRIDEFDIDRRELINVAQIRGDLNQVRTLLEIIYRPTLDFSERTGNYIYPRFLQQVMLYHTFSSHWPFMAGEGESADMIRRLRLLTPHMSDHQFDSLVPVVTSMFLMAAVSRGLQIREGLTLAPFEEYFGDLLDMATAAYLVAERAAASRAAPPLQ